MSLLLTRDAFNAAVLKRDGNKCVVCGKTESLDVHHIIERKLWDDGGYYLDNGVTLCGGCHLLAEMTTLTTRDIRQFAGISDQKSDQCLPPHLALDDYYDKWGNVMLPSGQLCKGEMFHTEQCQKMLTAAGKMDLVLPYVKYPRTMHLPWSPNLKNDDRVHEHMDQFEGKEVVVTIKMDGEGATLYNDFYHARSLTSDHTRIDKLRRSRSRVKQIHAAIKHEIPTEWRLCGENMQAEHSIRYERLPSPFLLFSVWDSNNFCLSWDDTVQIAEMLNLSTVSVLYRGIFDSTSIHTAYEAMNGVDAQGNRLEGYVVRNADKFHYSRFRIEVAKYVRKNHVQTDQHWLQSPLIENGFEN